MMMMLAINVIIIMMTKSIVHLFSCIANMYRLIEIIRNQLVVMKHIHIYVFTLPGGGKVKVINTYFNVVCKRTQIY